MSTSKTPTQTTTPAPTPSPTPTQTQTPAPTQTPWPDKPLIRVVSGYETEVGLVTGALAMRDAAGSYRLEGGGLLVPGTGDVIETWEEMRAVPVYRAPGSASPLRPDERHAAGPSAP